MVAVWDSASGVDTGTSREAANDGEEAVSQNNFFVFVETNIVFSHATKVFVFEDFGHFAVLQSSFHDEWARKYGSTLESRFRYMPGSCFETFAFPTLLNQLEEVGSRYYEFRNQIMQTRQEGLTKTYNRFHDRGEQSADIARLRHQIPLLPEP